MNRYPLWRYLLMIALIVFGILYALPVLYGEDPAIQITTKDASPLPTSITKTLSTALTQQKIPFKSIKRQKHNDVLVRFSSTEEQLKAQDVIEATLGRSYAVALNLAPRTPHWLQSIGAHPMRLGLDLRGGIHFLMQVDLKAMFKQRVTSDMHDMGNQLREENIRYAGITSNKQNVITISFRSSDDQQKALAYLNRNFRNFIFKAGDDNSITATMSTQAKTKLAQQAVTQNITTMRNRVRELGITDPVIIQQGNNQISVDLPGIQNTARAKDLIGKVATIRLQLVDTQNSAEQAAKTGIVPFGDTLYKTKDGQPILLKNQVVLHGRSILSASTIIGQDGRPAVSVRAGGAGVAFFNKITAQNIGKPMATVYILTQTNKHIVDGKVVTSQKQIYTVINVATIQSALGNSFQILGLQNMGYAKNLALLLRSGAYSAPLAIVSERTVGPTLGKENIRMGVLSCEVGTLLVIIFMAFYYRLFGLIADFALVSNVILLVAFMALLGFTLTLPGIAGIVLTVGMAVDANVLINERIREELRNGMTPQAAIHAGYERAFSTIVDANVTTLIVAVVLFALGTGPVQNFAITLTIGLLISMVTAIFFTRAIVNLIYGRRSGLKHISIGIKVRQPNAKEVNA